MAFLTGLGFGFEPAFTSDSAARMIVDQNIFVLPAESFLRTFTRKAPWDATKGTEVLVCPSCDSRSQVNDPVAKAAAAGGVMPR